MRRNSISGHPLLLRWLSLLCLPLRLAFAAPDALPPRFAAGLKFYKTGQCSQALDEMKASEQTGERAPARPFFQGVCLAKAGNWADASARLSVYVETAPSDAQGWYWLSQAQLFQRRFAEAEKAIQRAIAIDGNSAENYRTLGTVHLELGNHDQAYRAWLTANKLNPKDARTTYYLGRLFYNADFLNEAAAWFRETLKLDPKHFAAQNYLGQCAELLGFQSTALALYQDSVRQSKEQQKPYSWAFLSLGKLLRQQGHEDQALAIFEEAEQLCPEAHVLTALGQLLAAQHQRARAEAVLRRAVEMDPALADAHYRLSLLLRADGRTEAAEAEARKFQEAKQAEQRNKMHIQAIRKLNP